MSSPYLINFAEKIERVYFLQRIKLAHEKLRKLQHCEKYYCENNASGHHFEKFSPHPGCVKMVCKFCAEESPTKLFQPSVYSFKGRTFEFKRKDYHQAPRY